MTVRGVTGEFQDAAGIHRSELVNLSGEAGEGFMEEVPF